MKTTKVELTIGEHAFGSSTSAIVEVDGLGRIMSFQDTSTHQTNYVWDGWSVIPRKGDSFEKFISIIEEGLELDDDEFRTPFLIIKVVKKERRY